MCRFVAYLGKPVVISDLVVKPKNSLINQSFSAKELDEPLNGDGFGLGWYSKGIREEPGLFRSITPAWNNDNLRYQSEMIKTNCLLAHVRAATFGPVSEINSHPFHFGKYLMMHNGSIPKFHKIKREIRRMLNDEYYEWIQGQTDSEHIFALLMQNVAAEGEDISLPVLAECLIRTFNVLEELKDNKGITKPSLFNMVVTDGHRLVASRYSSNPDKKIHSLYYGKGKKYKCKNGVCKMVHADGEPGSVLIVSEPLNDINADWTEVPPNHCILIDSDLSHKIKSIEMEEVSVA